MPRSFHSLQRISGPSFFKVETKIPYQFTAVPSKLCYCLDKNCKAMLFALIDLHNLYSNQDGWFFRSNQDLQYDTDLSQNLVKVVLDTLYRAGIINVFSVGQGKGHTSNRIHINFESFTRYEAYSFNDIRNNPDLHIKTLPYKDHFSPSYCERVGDSESERVSEASSESIGEKMTTILDTPTSPDTSNTSYSIDNLLTNITIEEDPSGIETSIPEGGIELPEVATPVVPKASLPSISVEEPRNTYSTSTDNLTEKQLLLEDCLKSFWEIYKEKVDIQLLADNPQQFLKNNEVKICALHQQILFKAHRDITNQGIVMYLKDYVGRQVPFQEHEGTLPA